MTKQSLCFAYLDALGKAKGQAEVATNAATALQYEFGLSENEASTYVSRWLDAFGV